MLAFVVAHMLVLDQLISPLFAWIPDTLFQFASIEEGGDPLVGGALVVMIVAVFLGHRRPPSAGRWHPHAGRRTARGRHRRRGRSPGGQRSRAPS
jgi:hypothetical protein